mmetsp:Transcript_46196/g.98860  ORF Transcript_46196/g.98860 Transcript_46196/m.98860 type:complete len:202 (-) Transcript_46196:1087-1692(-)
MRMCGNARLMPHWRSQSSASSRGLAPRCATHFHRSGDPASTWGLLDLQLGHQSSLLHSLDVLLQQIPRCTPSCNAAVDDAVQQRAAAKAVLTVDASRDLTSRIQARDYSLTLLHRGIVGDGNASHCVMNHRCDNRNMEAVVDVHRQVVEELLPPLVVSLAGRVCLVFACTLRWCFLHLLRNVIVLLECLLQRRRIHSQFLC